MTSSFRTWPAGAANAFPSCRAEPFDAIEPDLLRLWGEERPPQAG